MQLLLNNIPKCCRNCLHYDWDTPDDGFTIWRYCSLGIWFPTKKKTCKKQKPIKNTKGE